MQTILKKIPEVTLLFWVMKICATTLGETAGDLLAQTLHVGYGVSSAILFGLFLAVLLGQLAARRYVPALYWAVILATSTAGTTLSDYMDRTLGLGYATGAAILVALLLTVLGLWWASEKSLSVSDIRTRRGELFYWTAILVSNTLGTALGDYLADSSGLGFGGGALLIGSLLAGVVGAYYFTGVSRVLLFWVAFVLTRPFGATFGDLLTKPMEKNGLGFGTQGSSLILLVILVGLVVYTTWRPQPPALANTPAPVRPPLSAGVQTHSLMPYLPAHRLYLASLWGFFKLIWQHHRKLLLGLLLGFIGPWLVFIKVSQEVWEDKGFPIDQFILEFLHQLGSPGQDAVAVWMARAGGTLWTPLVEAAALAGLLLARQRRAALFFLLSVGGAGALNLFAKLLLARARPTLWVSIAPETSYSFPSGHAMGAAALALTLGFLLWPTRARWVVVGLGTLWAVLMGWSRVYLGVHFPSDVLAGWVGSVGWVAGIHFLFDRSTLDLRQLWSDTRTYWLARHG